MKFESLCCSCAGRNVRRWERRSLSTLLPDRSAEKLPPGPPQDSHDLCLPFEKNEKTICSLLETDTAFTEKGRWLRCPENKYNSMTDKPRTAEHPPEKNVQALSKKAPSPSHFIFHTIKKSETRHSPQPPTEDFCAASRDPNSHKMP